MKGYALPVVLFMIGLGGALAAGGAFVARRQVIDQRTMSGAGSVDGLAEEWAARTIAEWDTSSNVPVGGSVNLSDVVTSAGTVSRWVTRTNSSVYWIVVEVTRASKPFLRRRLGAVTVAGKNGLLLAPGWAWSDLP